MAAERFYLSSHPRRNYKTHISHCLLLLFVLGCVSNAQDSSGLGTNEIIEKATNTTPAPQKNQEWSYEEENHWTNNFEACKGHHQSPIAITTSSCYKNLTTKPFSFNDAYRKPPTASTVINTGHTAQITITDNATFSGGPLPDGNYNFVQLHFHWGGNDSLGSEHTLDGKRYPLELHLVHYHQNYSVFGDALGKKGGVAVLGVWFELSKHDNARLKPLIEAFAKIKNKGDTSRVFGQQSLFDFLPDDKSSYFHYDGSLTTPSCVENVMWVIFTAHEGISHSQLEAFRDLQEEKIGAPATHHLENNFRHTQPLYDRTVYLVTSSCHRGPTTPALFLIFGLTIISFILY